MVLEDASSGNEPISSSFSENVPSSDIDPYANASASNSTRDPSFLRIEQPNAAPIFVNLANLPKPVYHARPDAETLKRPMDSAVKSASQLLKRPVRQEEAEAFTYHFCNGLRTASWGPVIGGILGAVQIFRTRNKGFRFPGWTPMKEGSNFSPQRFGPLRGEYAASAWSAARTAAYLSVGAIGGSVLVAPYGVARSMAGYHMDPRLRDYSEALRAKVREKRNLPAPAQQNEGEGARAGETYEMARQRRSVQRAVTSRGQREQVDDMSPTGGAFQQDLNQSQADTGLMDDSQVNSYNSSRESEQMRNASSESAEGTRNASSRQPRVLADQSRSKSSGSSWDRLRQDAMSGGTRSGSSKSSTPRSDGSSTSSSGNESFSFSQREEDGQLARSEAQKDFDARVEREREGKNFDEGRGGRRW